jgi:hypothetical protein
MCAVLYGDGAAVKEDSKASNDASATALMWAINDPEEVRLLRERIASMPRLQAGVRARGSVPASAVILPA